MNPLFKDKLFIPIAALMWLLLVYSTVGVTLDAYESTKFISFSGSAADWRAVFEIYQVPLSIAVGLFALFALFTSIHRVSLQAEQTNMQLRQIEDAQKLNKFNIYFKQREEFDKKFQVSMGEWSKAVQRNTNIRNQKSEIRNHEWFDDFDHAKWLDVDVSEEKLKRVAGIACFNLYEFSFGSGRNVFLTQDFRSFVTRLFDIINELDAAQAASEKDVKKSQANIHVLEALAKTEKFSDWCMLYKSEWFSLNEKFNLSLALARLYAEIEAFAGEPRDIAGIGAVTPSGQSAEHALFFGPNLLLGERKLSPAGSQGRVPSLLSRLIKPTSQIKA